MRQAVLPSFLAILLVASAAGQGRVAYAGASGRAADPKAEQEAREHVRKGADALRGGRYDEAMKEFEAGYALLPRPGFVLNMAHVQRQAGNLARARGYYRQYLDLDPGSAQRKEVEKAIAEIDVALAQPMRGPAQPGGTAPSPAGASAARRPISLSPTVDDSEVPVDLKLTASEPVRKREEPVPAPDDGAPFYQRWWFWGTAGGVVVAGALGFFLLRPRGDDFTMSGTWGTLGK